MNLILNDTKEIKGDIKEIKKNREEDHFVRPIEKSEKLRNQIFGVVIGILVSGFVVYLFPMLN